VTRLEPGARAISHLSASAAEAWCLDGLTIPIGNVSDDAPFWVLLSYQREDPRTADDSNSGLTLSGLVDIFSRRNPRQPLTGSWTGGPFRMPDLRRK
jgi:hypothetical protein